MRVPPSSITLRFFEEGPDIVAIIDDSFYDSRRGNVVSVGTQVHSCVFGSADRKHCCSRKSRQHQQQHEKKLTLELQMLVGGYANRFG